MFQPKEPAIGGLFQDAGRRGNADQNLIDKLIRWVTSSISRASPA